MKSHINFLLIVILASFASVGFGRLEPTAGVPAPAAAEANAVSVPSFPYIAEITGDNVYIRSGPGMNYYSCGKLNKAEKVKVVSRQFSWSCIVPPTGSFSWIYIPYVSIDPDNPGTGIVTGDNVRVYAGSDVVKAIHSILQLKLDRGEKVKLLGEQKENYYKIAPPSGAYLWVSTKFTQPYVASVGPTPITGTIDPNEPSDPNEATVVVRPVKVSVEAEKLKEYHALEKKLQAERAKPMEQQNYASIKKALEAIAKNKDAGRTARYCEFVIRQIERYELVQVVSKELDLQNKQLQADKERIDKARSTRLARVKNLGRFAVVGKLQISSIHGPDTELKRYRIIGESGKTMCYARPISRAVQPDLSALIGRKVGLVGTISAYPQTAGALVKFTEVVELK